MNSSFVRRRDYSDIFVAGVEVWRGEGNDRLTGQRAEQVVQAAERYYEREGRYPATLDEVTVWPRRRLPGPFILYGQNWCYDGGPDYYRLGYLTREHWSAPHRIPQLYNAVGELPDLDPLCGLRVVYQFSHETGGQ